MSNKRQAESSAAEERAAKIRKLEDAEPALIANISVNCYERLELLNKSNECITAEIREIQLCANAKVKVLEAARSANYITVSTIEMQLAFIAAMEDHNIVKSDFGEYRVTRSARPRRKQWYFF